MTWKNLPAQSSFYLQCSAVLTQYFQFQSHCNCLILNQMWNVTEVNFQNLGHHPVLDSVLTVLWSSVWKRWHQSIIFPPVFQLVMQCNARFMECFNAQKECNKEKNRRSSVVPCKCLIMVPHSCQMSDNRKYEPLFTKTAAPPRSATVYSVPILQVWRVKTEHLRVTTCYCEKPFSYSMYRNDAKLSLQFTYKQMGVDPQLLTESDFRSRSWTVSWHRFCFVFLTSSDWHISQLLCNNGSMVQSPLLHFWNGHPFVDGLSNFLTVSFWECEHKQTEQDHKMVSTFV